MKIANQTAIAELMTSGRFDPEWYRGQYPDVDLSGLSPAEHYLLIGLPLGRGGTAEQASATSATVVPTGSSPALDSPPFEGFGIIRHDPLISVLIVSFNSGRDLEALLPTIACQSYQKIEIVLVENGEEDTEPLLAKHFAHYHYVRTDNVGFAEANNMALDLASGELIALINPDTRLERDMIQNLLDSLRFDNEAAVAVPKIYFFERFVRLTIRANAPFWVARGELLEGLDYRKLFVRWGSDEGLRIVSDSQGKMDIDLPFTGVRTTQLTLRALQGRLTECMVQIGFSGEVGMAFDNTDEFTLTLTFDETNCSSARHIVNNAGSDVDPAGGPYDRGFGQFDDGAFYSKTYVNALCGCAALIRRSAIIDRKLFISAFFAYYEDSELSHWLRSRDYRILYQPAAVIYHRHSESMSESSPLWRVLVGRSRKLYDVTTGKEVLPPPYFDYAYPDDFQHPLRAKLESFDHMVRSAPSIEELTRKERPIACIYNTYFSSMGGGEKHALDVASLLREKYEVYLASEEDFSLADLEKYFSVPLDGVKKIVSTNIDKHFTAKFDLFVNSTFRSNLRSLAKRNLYLVSFPHCDQHSDLIADQTFIHNSHFTAEWANEYWGKHHSTVILPILGQASLFANAKHAGGKGKNILSVGRMTFEGHCKNQHQILNAFRELAQKPGFDPDWKLVLLGSCNFRDRSAVQYYHMLRELAQGYNVEVLVNQPRAAVEEAYREAAIYVHATGLGVPASLPDRHEHFGIAPFEAMAYGCLPVVYIRGGPADQARSAGEGHFFADYAELIEAMDAAMARVNANDVPHAAISSAAQKTFEGNIAHARNVLLSPD